MMYLVLLYTFFINLLFINMLIINCKNKLQENKFNKIEKYLLEHLLISNNYIILEINRKVNNILYIVTYLLF